MRSKTSLTLLEQIVMLLVFALAASLCLKAFLWADQTSARSAAKDQAVILAQSAAERLKHARGDVSQAAEGGFWEGQTWLVGYDEQWNTTHQEAVYYLSLEPRQTDVPYLETANVRVTDARGEVLFAIPVAWQEVEP